MADDLRGMVVPVDETAARDSSDSLAAWGWVGLIASERGLRLLALPSATRAAALRAIRYDFPDAALVEFKPGTSIAAGCRPAVSSEAGAVVNPEVLLQAVAGQVRAYFAGDLREFTVPLDLRGHTSFALTVWAIALRIPYSQTRTYAWIARQVGGNSQGIYQAVGAALGSNPIPVIIPCHRVIGSDGSLHGYAGGLAMKARLLALETGQARLLI